jgi:predicted MPP superfamily phosphohydrolase
MLNEYNMKNLKSVQEILARDARLIRLPAKGKAVFVGDTHGDLDATKTVFSQYFKPGYTLVFLGDYVDRGPDSKDNIEFLLEKKMEAPDQVFLLMGNHEGYCSVPFSPADFWESLAPHEHKSFSDIFQFLSFAVVTENGLIAVHGVPPDVMTLEEINNIQLCSEQWHQLTWGDFLDMQGDVVNDLGDRPKFGEDYFRSAMKQLGKNVLIRSHQPRIKPVIFDKRCLTLITSYAYTFMRLIAIADMEKPIINSVDDLEIVEI